MQVCQEHVELALDMIVDEYETAPSIQPVSEDGSCEFCRLNAQYVVSNRPDI
ncbi:CxxH/CxxC protein [Bacillaceae bacterium SIJ1]|nr:CxxH/CxxC protein [Litoribacterium kuwaitense]